MEGLSLIDVSSEDDLLFSSHSGDLIDQKSSGTIKEGDCAVLTNKQMEPALCLAESPEKKRTKSDKYNLRKSLAWDSAFFTSEGVLDQEELATVNCIRKTELSTLSSIPEEIRQSVETSSTFDADSMALEDIEQDLFENVRASIQKSLSSSHKGLKGAQGNEKRNLVKGHSAPIRTAKKIESSSVNKKKSPIAVDRNNGKKEPHNLKVNDGPICAKAVVKPPRILSKSALPDIPNKINFVAGNSQVRSASTKCKQDDLVTQKSVALHKKVIGVSGGSTSRSVQNLKPPGIPSRSCGSTTVSSAVCTISSGNPSDSTAKSKLETARKHGASRYAPSARTLPSKTPLKLSRTKIVKSCDKTCQTSMSKLSSSISPTSSFDSITSEVSSSASVAIRSMGDSIDSGSTSLSPSFSGVPDEVKAHSSGISSLTRNLLPRHPVNKGSLKDCQVTESSGGKRTRGSNQVVSEMKCSKPSGLKLPTPKIGYFEKSLTRNVETFSQTTQLITSNSITNGVGNSTLVNKPMPSKLLVMSPSSQTLALHSASPLNSTNLSAIHNIESTPPVHHQNSAESFGALELQQQSSSVLDSHPLKVEDKSLHVLEVADITAIGQFPSSTVQDQPNFLRQQLTKDISKEVEAMCISDGNYVVTGGFMEITSTMEQKWNLDTEKENISPTKTAKSLNMELQQKSLDTGVELVMEKMSSFSLGQN